VKAFGGYLSIFRENPTTPFSLLYCEEDVNSSMLLDTQDLWHHVVDVAGFFFSQEFSQRDPSFPRLCISPQSFFFNRSLVGGIIALFAQISDPNSSSFFLVPEFSLAPIA
jgi:hypothetical protein